MKNYSYSHLPACSWLAYTSSLKKYVNLIRVMGTWSFLIMWRRYHWTVSWLNDMKSNVIQLQSIIKSMSVEKCEQIRLSWMRLPCLSLGWRLQSKRSFPAWNRIPEALNISDFQGRSYLRQCMMLSHYGQCLLSLNLAMGLIMPEHRLWGNFSDLPPKLLLFYNLFKTVLFLSHWSCCWLDGFVNLHWLCLKQWCVRVCSFRRWFLVRVVFTVAIIPCHTLAYRKLCWRL